jgi:PAS domain-containing protein
MLDADGVQTGVVGVTTDETEQRAATEALAARTTALAEQAELLDLAHDAIVVCRRDGTISYWNRGAERIHGHTADQQLQAPVNQGVFTSHYLLFMLGATTWF